MDIESIKSNLSLHGPTRVVINAEGETKPPDRACKEDGVLPLLVFIRNDGWTLGASYEHLEVARKMWADEWVGCYNLSTCEYSTYVETPV